MATLPLPLAPATGTMEPPPPVPAGTPGEVGTICLDDLELTDNHLVMLFQGHDVGKCSFGRLKIFNTKRESDLIINKLESGNV
jgi:hypothetical protein